MNCRTRILHGAPNNPSLTVYTKDNLIQNKVSYKDLTEYCLVDSGHHHFKVFSEQKHQAPLIEAYSHLLDNTCHTIILAGRPSDLSLFVVPDAYFPKTDRAYLRFVNLVPDTDLDFTFSQGAFILVNDIEFKEVTEYYPATPGTYTVRVYLAGTNHLLLTIPDFTLRRGKAYTIYIHGLRDDNYAPIDYMFCSDGSDY